MKKNVSSIVLSVSVLLSSCSYPHFYYSPNVQNVPLFQESNKFSGHVAGSFGTENNCLEIQTGYSLPGHVALMVNYMRGGKDNSSENYDDYSKIKYFEGMLGYYKSFKDIGVFEIYGGYGHGAQIHAFAYNENEGWFGWTWVPDGKADMSFSKIFIQPDIGIKTGPVEGAFSCRLSKLDFNEINIYNTVYRLEELNLLKQNSSSWIIEPAFTFRAGFESVKVQVQVIFAGNISNPDLAFEKFRFNVGLHLYLGKKKTI
jgi:hypothetical protein